MPLQCIINFVDNDSLTLMEKPIVKLTPYFPLSIYLHSHWLIDWCVMSVYCVFLIDVLTVSHLHPPAHRKPFRACCPWQTCHLQTACNRPGATASPRTIASQRTTLTAHRLARRLQEPTAVAAITASGQTNVSRRKPERAAVLTVWSLTMIRITWMHASRTLIMVKPNHPVWIPV